LTPALEGGEGSASRPDSNPRERPGTHFTGGWLGLVWKISPPPGLDAQTVQPVGILYTDYATRTTNVMVNNEEM